MGRLYRCGVGNRLTWLLYLIKQQSQRSLLLLFPPIGFQRYRPAVSSADRYQQRRRRQVL